MRFRYLSNRESLILAAGAFVGFLLGWAMVIGLAPEELLEDAAILRSSNGCAVIWVDMMSKEDVTLKYKVVDCPPREGS